MWDITLAYSVLYTFWGFGHVQLNYIKSLKSLRSLKTQEKRHALGIKFNILISCDLDTAQEIFYASHACLCI